MVGIKLPFLLVEPVATWWLHDKLYRLLNTGNASTLCHPQKLRNYIVVCKAMLMDLGMLWKYGANNWDSTLMERDAQDNRRGCSWRSIASLPAWTLK
jgi:hypothetical protein